MDVVFLLGQYNVLLIYGKYSSLLSLTDHSLVSWQWMYRIISVYLRQFNRSNRVQRKLEHVPIKVMVAAWNETMAIVLNQIGLMVQSEWSAHAYRHTVLPFTEEVREMRAVQWLSS